MKKIILLTIVLIFAYAGSNFTQDISRLKKLSSDLRSQTADLVTKTEKDMQKAEIRSRDEIESAFMAKQLHASVELLESLIKEKAHTSEMRYAGMVLSDMASRFPIGGKNNFEWKKAKDTIASMSRELRGFSASVPEKDGYEVDEEKIIGKTFWNGTVDKDVQIVISGNNLAEKTVSGKEFEGGAFSFTASLPQKERTRVGIRKKRGRGEAHVMQQPTEENDFTAIIQIHDEAGGADDYSLEIYWYKR